MVSVLFVCLGNICRSPMAEAIFRHYVIEEGLENEIHIDSAGTGDWHIGEPPHQGTMLKLKEYGISSQGIYARQVKQNDFDQFQWIVGMDTSNVENLHKIAQTTHSHVYPFIQFIPGTAYEGVPDPWYTGNFQETYDLVQQGCKNLLNEIVTKHGLSKK
ncbi:protein-tyrosine phosphatase [Croceifilum oryzae]|uniref:protein-tyrosine-phosphatase n=1 Tax=Croceifilum oryzae TaxID=1553429 RepID=A0AAJ1TK50_9BACL|nr:low molecular weight protein-tyrosine-phosphatase [Croceifilum oryzae]MDQ0417544.1 protein-tyrosine phosphatase [Croceifilum oryzae]